MSISYNEKVKLFTNCIQHIPNERVPLLGIVQTWAVAHAGMTFDEAVKTTESEASVFTKLVTDFYFDGILSAGFDRPQAAFEHLGYKPYYAAPDGVTMMVDSDSTILFDDELDRFIADPQKFFREVAVGRRFPMFTDNTPNGDKELMAAGRELWNYSMATGKKAKILKKAGTPVLAGGICSAPLDLYLLFRGYMPALTDFRKRPDKVREAVASIEKITGPLSPKAKLFPCAVSPVTSLNYLNPKLADEFFWPTYMKNINKTLDTGTSLVIFAEGKWGPHNLERLLELPKDRILVILENDDFFDAQKRVGHHVALTYPFPTQKLKFGTPDEVKDEAKRVLDTIGDTGVAMCMDKNLMSPSDVSVENLRAFCDTCRDYK